ncbi:MAG: malto-oligosyltrehalose synthase [Desulfuromonadales bacterium]|nr:malto-oligosyltrehalose synthase [Desulfuromonadales bacterium]
MRIPAATYRLQFTPEFGFEQAREIVPYLRALGVSDLYASPIFHARPGSLHGYDVVDPNAFNPQLGTPESFQRLLKQVRLEDLGWLQDIVPNHMAFDRGNHYLVDLLENGASSRYYQFFDIGWEHFYDILQGRVLAPFLGSFYGEALESGQLQLTYDEEGFSVNYYAMRFALKIESYLHLLLPCQELLRGRLGDENSDYVQLLGVLYVLKTLRVEAGELDRYNQIKFIKNTLWNLYRKNQDIRRQIDHTLTEYNGRPGDRESFTPLDHLLGDQNFRLSFWKVAAEEINYRRFFSINDLISLQAEREEVFAETHRLILEQTAAGNFTGLRIDHIDGLCNPAQYLERLRRQAGDQIYIVVEKITAPGEPLPDWPIQGTTGYEFMNRVGGLFCRQQNARAFSRLYASFIGSETPFEEMVYEKKKLMVERHMMGDINNLAHLLKTIASRHRYGIDITMYSLRRSLIEIMAAFPVYRSYLHPQGEREADRRYIHQAIQAALARNPGLANEFRYLEKILLLAFDEFVSPEEQQEWLHFVMRFQQFTGPLMAKGFEDTLLYVYNRLLSLNEVGGAPERFGFSGEEFHAYCQRRQAEWPHALSATATHDHKRGEDMRARLQVLSELPQEWGRQLRAWSRLNRRHKGRLGRRKMPSANDEYFFYQTLLGTWPFSDFDRQEYLDRIKEYAVKAVREAKVYTAWIKPDQEYEQTYLDFVEKILSDEPFMSEFLPFQRRLAWYGMSNSLGQLLLKMTAPGVPDFYQGTELWDLSLVDPDNRRPVDYRWRRQLLAQLQVAAKKDLPALLAELLAHPEDGRIKLYLLWRALTGRHQQLELFQTGDYLPLTVEGRGADHLFAFARRQGGKSALVVVPRFLTSLVAAEEWALGEPVWKDTLIHPPPGETTGWRNILTDEPVAAGDRLKAADLLHRFPLGLLLPLP